ncbi:Putative analog of CcoH [Oxalobacteraceae bacterium IMCC9480]|nr:Putative analog of CcoH [Oxalobacteraceae bacterium IMCC9480]NDP59677.1 FixH family protein [Oxalobacteraceae bacterium]
MHASTLIHKPAPWYKHRWPWLLMLGPFLVIVAGSVTIWLAVTHQDALVVDDYYMQGKAINLDLRRDRVATAMGLSFIGQIDAATDTLSGTLFAAGPPPAGKIRVHLAHPTLPQKDIQLITALDERGHFQVALPLLDRAVWQILIESEQRDWRLNGELKWPEQKVMMLSADVPPHP